MNIEINTKKRVDINEVQKLAKFLEEAQADSDSLIREYHNIESAILEFGNYDSTFLKAYTKRELVGMVFGCNSIFILKNRYHKCFPGFYISDIAVKINYRNMGIAKIMLNELESIVKKQGYRSILADAKYDGRSYNLFKSIEYIDTKKYSNIGFCRLEKTL